MNAVNFRMEENVGLILQKYLEINVGGEHVLSNPAQAHTLVLISPPPRHVVWEAMWTP
jgi:hypothetical protein